MKYKILSAVIATALLNGCGGTDPSTTVQAYDPAVANMSTSYSCADGTVGTAGKTDSSGNVVISDSTFALNTSTCDLTFVGGADAKDMSNGKSMNGVTYQVPRGMAVNGQKVAGSPTSTLLYKVLGGANYTTEAASQLLTDLGLGDLVNGDNSNLAALFLDPETAAAALTPEKKSRLLATMAVLGDVIKNGGTASAAALTSAAKTIAAKTITDYPAYPANSSGTNIYLIIPATLVSSVVAAPTAAVTLPTAIVAVPQTETTTPGGTGGTGGTGAGSTPNA